jgi:hypothetical protein
MSNSGIIRLNCGLESCVIVGLLSARAVFFFFTTESRPTVGPTHSPIIRSTGELPDGKVARAGADHSPPYFAELALSYTSTPSLINVMVLN